MTIVVYDDKKIFISYIIGITIYIYISFFVQNKYFMTFCIKMYTKIQYLVYEIFSLSHFLICVSFKQ